MIAEDSEEMARRLAALLEQIDGVKVIGPARDGQEAVRLFTRASPDVAVLDLNLPDVSGVAVLKAIRRAGRGCFVIISTVDAQPSMRERCLEAGADRFLSKVSDIERLVELIRVLVNKSSSFL